MMNPFEVIEQRLSSIENLLLTIQNQPQQVEPTEEKNRKHDAPGAANFLGIALPTLYTKVSKGELPVCKAPGSKRLFFFEADLINYLQSGRKLTTAEIQQQANQYLTNKKRGA